MTGRKAASMTQQLKALNISNTVYFKGTDAEIEQAERLEAERTADIEKIIDAPGFTAMRYVNENGQQRILHHSTRNGVMFQLSYIDADGVPAMHENFIQTGKKHVDEAIHSREDLIRHYIHASNHGLTLEII